MEGVSIKERDFQNWLVDVAQRLGYAVWHVPAPMRWDSRGGKGFVGAKEAAGLADLILVGKTRLLFIEAKGTGGKLSAKQIAFLGAVSALDSFDVKAYAFWPGDEEKVEAALRGP